MHTEACNNKRESLLPIMTIAMHRAVHHRGKTVLIVSEETMMTQGGSMAGTRDK